jgi:hypothetical protein
MGVCACDGTPTAPSAQSATLVQFSLTPATVDAGARSEGTVTLAARAPASGIEVRLSSSDGVAVVPASIMVLAGAISATFTVTTRLVAADTNATISALLGADKRDVVLRVMAPIARPPTLQALEIEPFVLKGGQNAQGTIRLTGSALAPMAVTVRSNNTLATVPGSVTVPTGASSATFTVTTRPVTLDTVFDITATLADQARSAQIRLTP